MDKGGGREVIRPTSHYLKQHKPRNVLPLSDTLTLTTTHLATGIDTLRPTEFSIEPHASQHHINVAKHSVPNDSTACPLPKCNCAYFQVLEALQNSFPPAFCIATRYLTVAGVITFTTVFILMLSDCYTGRPPGVISC